ncbi:MAG: sodium:proton antiporter, partial [Candidatus Adiutrix sp.]|nr:sodium:proton antiporter [Candidatus Adiutrix sp.]
MGADAALAAAGTYHLDGSALSGWWALPFAGMLLSIAFCPLVVPHFWHHHFGKVAAGWAVIFAIPCWLVFGSGVAMYTILETILLEYLPFVILLLSLFTIAGGIRLTGTLIGTPKLNTILIFVGTLLASWMGTTGAAMLFIRPLLRANAHRRHKVHTVVFFIFLVANIGGSLTPL